MSQVVGNFCLVDKMMFSSSSKFLKILECVAVTRLESYNWLSPVTIESMLDTALPFLHTYQSRGTNFSSLGLTVPGRAGVLCLSYFYRFSLAFESVQLLLNNQKK